MNKLIFVFSLAFTLMLMSSCEKPSIEEGILKLSIENEEIKETDI